MPSDQPIPFIRALEPTTDDRGVFMSLLASTNALSEQDGLAIKRVYSVYNYATGIVRGFHYHKREWKYFVIVAGAAKFIAINPDKPEERFVFVSSVRRPNLVVVPPGFANAWVSLEPSTMLVCASTASLEESIADDHRYDPYTWGDLWSVKGR